MAANDDLTPEQTEKLLQFQDLTGIDDIDRCQQILDQHGWDIEVAVQARLSEEEGTMSAFHDHHENHVNHLQQQLQDRLISNSPPLPPVVATSSHMNVFTVNRRQPQGFFQWSYYMLMFPFQFVYSSLFGLFRFIYRLVKPDPRTFVVDPVGDVQHFIVAFNGKYGANHPRFFEGSYSQALNQAKQQLEFLLVYLHYNSHQDTDLFCRATLCNNEVTEFVNSRMLFWACDTDSPEGYRVANALHSAQCPFLALIVLRNGRMTIVAKIEGAIEPNDLLVRLHRLTTEYGALLEAARLDRLERSQTQLIRNEQDQAYMESLLADQQKERQKAELRQQEEERKRELERLEEERLNRLEEIRQRKERLRCELPAEPDADSGDVIRIRLRLPNGHQLERRFLRSQSLKDLWSYVFVHELAPDNFQIVSSFPPRTIACEPTDACPLPPSFAEAGLGKMESLLVIDNEA